MGNLCNQTNETGYIDIDVDRFYFRNCYSY